MSRDKLLEQIKQRYLFQRVARVEPEFLEFEEEMASEKDLEKILYLLRDTNECNKPNPHNSALLYVTGLSNIYRSEASVDTVGGAAPDVDMDFDTMDYDKIVDWVTDYYGREKVANIMALQTFKPRSTARKYYMVTEPKQGSALEKAAHYKIASEVLNMIPPPQYGKEPTLDEAINGSKEKGYEPHPQLLSSKYKDWYEVASKLEGMVSTFSIHAAGIVVSDDPISDHIPIWFRKTKDENGGGMVGRWATQFTKDELEELGLLKFDFLRVESLSIIKETIRLIKERTGLEINPWSIEDGDHNTYQMLGAGEVAGVFQLETSRTAKDLCKRIKPSSIEEISDLSALNRPGPIQAGLTEAYIANKANKAPPEDMPSAIADLLKDTYWTLCYQEQIMFILNKVAGFSLKEADDIRRAIGKKKVKYLEPYMKQFIQGLIDTGVQEYYAEKFWQDIVGFADYC